LVAVLLFTGALGAVRDAVFSDAFPRPDSTDVGTWWDAGYSGLGSSSIVGQRVRATALADGTNETLTVSLPNNQYAQATLATFTGTILLYFVLHVRFAAPTANTGYGCVAARNDGAKTSYIARNDAGVENILVTENATT